MGDEGGKVRGAWRNSGLYPGGIHELPGIGHQGMAEGEPPGGALTDDPDVHLLAHIGTDFGDNAFYLIVNIRHHVAGFAPDLQAQHRLGGYLVESLPSLDGAEDDAALRFP